MANTYSYRCDKHPVPFAGCQDCINRAATQFLERIDHITTDEFATGQDVVEREALRIALELPK